MTADPTLVYGGGEGGSAGYVNTDYAFLTQGDAVSVIVGAGGATIRDHLGGFMTTPNGTWQLSLHESKHGSGFSHGNGGRGRSNGTGYGSGGGGGANYDYDASGSRISGIPGIGTDKGLSGSTVVSTSNPNARPDGIISVGGNGGAGAVFVEYYDPAA
jgi:hypothetical protein